MHFQQSVQVTSFSPNIRIAYRVGARAARGKARHNANDAYPNKKTREQRPAIALSIHDADLSFVSSDEGPRQARSSGKL